MTLPTLFFYREDVLRDKGKYNLLLFRKCFIMYMKILFTVIIFMKGDKHGKNSYGYNMFFF